MMKSMLAVLLLDATAQHTAAQTPTLGNVTAPLVAAERAAGVPNPQEAKTWPEWTRRYNALPALIARTATKPAAPVVQTPGRVDRDWYLRTYPDIAAAGVDPQAHYDSNGRWEGRLAYEGAPVFRPTAPAEYAAAPACSLRVSPTWAPAGAKVIRVRFSLVRGAEPCERSYAIYGHAANPGADNAPEPDGLTGLNISAQPQPIQGDALTLPSQGSIGEIVINVPDWAQRDMSAGWFNLMLRSVEYNPIVAWTTIRVRLGGARPAGYAHNPEPLALPAATRYPTLATPDYTTDFLGDFGAAGWRFSAGSQINGMVGVFTAPDSRTASGRSTDNYPVVDGVRRIVLRDHRNDPTLGHLFSSGIMSRVLGDGTYGYRLAVLDLPVPLPGTDAAYWGIKPDHSWPPEFDTQEGFHNNPGRLAQTIHMPVNGAPTIGFTPTVDVYGKHEWLEEFGRVTYRLWVDRRLVVERPNYLSGIAFETTFGIEGPGGAGGAMDLSQPYDGYSMGLHRLSWWQAR